MVTKAKTQPKKVLSTSASRTRKLTKKQQKEKSKKTVKTQPIPSSFKLLIQVSKVFKNFWKPLGGIMLVYIALNIIFAGGLSNLGTAVDSIKTNIKAGNTHFSDALGGFGSLIGASSGSGSTQGSSTTQSALLVIISLAIIWSLRQLLSNKTIAVKQAYYQSMSPLVPFMLVIFVIILQLLPLTLGALIMATILSGVYVGTGVITFITGLIFILLAAWSVYMLCSSIFALYIVTLPNMQPRQALRSAKKLVNLRRWSILRRLLFLPVFIFVAMGIIIVPIILLATWLVAPVFYALGVVAILFAHSYLYSLYRGLLDE